MAKERCDERGQGFRAKERYVLWSAALRTRQRNTDTSCASSVSPSSSSSSSLSSGQMVSNSKQERRINFPVSVVAG